MSDLKSKMYNYEVVPPANTWEKIEYALDEKALSSKLQHLEVSPPAGVWKKINSSLDAEKNIPVRNIRKITPLFRYASAAVVVIGLITFGIIKFSSKTSNDKEFAKKEILPVDSIHSSQTGNNSSDSTILADQQRDDEALEASKKTFARLDMSENNKRELRQALMMSPVDPISSTSPDYNCLEVCFPDNVRTVLNNSPAINTAERYILIMTPDGNIFRVSKKLSDLVCCVSGEDDAEECKDQLNKWRQKIAKSPVAPSPSNFMDIVSLVELLKDNNP